MTRIFPHITTDRCAELLFFGAILAFLLPPAAQAQSSPQVRFDNANQHLTEGEYYAALEKYRELESDNHLSGALFLNMGIAYARVDSLGKAKYYFMKSRGYGETRQRAREGLEFVENRFSRQSAVLPKLPWQRAIEWIQEYIGARTLLGGGLLLLNLGVILIVIRWFRSRWQKVLKHGGYSLLAAGLLIIAVSFYARHLDQRYSRAVMVTREADVREEPGENAPNVSRAFEGYTFTVDHRRSDDRGGWYYVRMSNGLYGWIPAENLMVL